MSDQKSHSTEQPERKEHFAKQPDWEQRLRFFKKHLVQAIKVDAQKSTE